MALPARSRAIDLRAARLVSPLLSGRGGEKYIYIYIYVQRSVRGARGPLSCHGQSDGPSRTRGAEQARLTLESRISVIIEKGGAGGGEGKILNRLHNKQMTISLPLILPCLGWIHFCIIVF